MLTQEMRNELVRRHGKAEAAGDMEGTLATMEPDPVYYMFPAGKKFHGLDNVRRYYEIMFEQAFPRIEGFEQLREWTNETSALVEYSVRAKHEDGVRTHRIICIYSFGETGITGETMYTDDALFRIFAGPMWDDLEPA